MSKASKTINEELQKMEDSLIELNEIAIEYIQEMDQYNQITLYDSSILKKRMKDTVMRVVSYDI